MIDDLLMKRTTIRMWHCAQQMKQIILLYHFARSNSVCTIIRN